MAEGGKGAIRAGSGYIDVEPRLDRSAMTRLRESLLKQMQSAGTAAGKELAAGIDKGLTQGVKSARKAAQEMARQSRTAAKEQTKAAEDSARKLNLIERNLTRFHGEQAGQRFRTFQRLNSQRMKMEENTSKATRKAISDVVAFERKAIQESIKADQTRAREKTKAQKDALTDTRRRIAAEKKEEQALAREVRQVQKQIRDAQRKTESERAKAQRDALAETRQRVAAERKEERALATEVRQVQRELASERKAQMQERTRQERQALAETRQRIAGEKREERALLGEVRQVQREVRAEQQRTAQQARQAERARIAAAREVQRQELTLLRQMRDTRANDLRNRIQANQTLRQDLQAQIRDQQAALRTIQTTQSRTWATVSKSWKQGSQHLEHLGTSAYEAGNLITTHLLAPLTAVSSVLTVIGVKNADMRMMGQLGMTAAGVSQPRSAAEMKRIQQYAINTPYSLDIMHEYQMKLIRGIASNDNEWFKPATKTKAANKAAGKASDVLMAIGDNMAQAGNIAPEQFQRAMYALDMIIDLDRAPTRNFKQLVHATGIPAQEFARMLGFKNATKMYEKMGTPTVKGGGIKGQEVLDAILKNWNGKDGAKGQGEKIGTATISGKLQQFKENAVAQMGQLFATTDKNGKVVYTGLGERIMGKQGKDGEYKGGLLNDIKDIAKISAPWVEDVLTTFFDTLGTFTGWIKDTVQFLDEHPGLRDMLLQAAKMAAVAAPFLLGLGVLTKTLGKLGKILQLALAPAKLFGSLLGGTAKGLRGIARTGRQVSDGMRSRATGGRFLEGYDARRDNYRETDDRRRRNRERFGNARRENGTFRTLGQYGQQGLARTTGYSGLRDYLNSSGNARRDRRDLEERSRQAFREGRLSDGVRLNRQAEGVRENHRQRRQITRQNARDFGPRDSVDRRQAGEDNVRRLQQELENADQAADRLRDALREVRSTNLNDLRDSLGGSTNSVQSGARQATDEVRQLHTQLGEANRTQLNTVQNALAGNSDSVQSSAQQAMRAIREVSTQVENANRSSLNTLQLELTNTKDKGESLKQSLREVGDRLTAVNARKMGTLREQQMVPTQNRADDLKQAIDHAADSVSKLNRKSLKGLRQQFTSTTTKVGDTDSKVKGLSSRTVTLNGRSLSKVKGQFDKLKGAASDASAKVGTTKSGLTGRIVTLNGRSTGKVTKQVDNLGSALKSAAKHASDLRKDIDDVNAATGGGSSSDGTGKHRKGKKKFARGGVLPGYAPGVDTIPAMLSPGEAILRPEVAHHIGADQINAWNQAAIKGQLTKHARGFAGRGTPRRGTGGGGNSPWPLSLLEQMADNWNITAGVRTFGDGVEMGAAGARIGGSTGRSVSRWGTQAGGDSAGRLVNTKVNNIRQFALSNLPDLLKRAPTGVSQVVGAVAGALAPTAGQLFWDDIWKGNGNVLDRGGKFMGDFVSAIPNILKDIVNGAVDSFTDGFKAIKDFAKDPMGFVDNTLGSIKGMFQGLIDQSTAMMEMFKSIFNNPGQYASDTLDAFTARVKELLPNTEGLFKFANGGIVPGYSPDNDRVKALLSPGEAVLRPEAVRQLGYQTIMDLNKGAKVGKDITDKATGKSSLIIPSPDNETFDSSVKAIEASLSGANKSIQQHRTTSNAAWDSAGSKVKSSVEGRIKPALSSYRSTLSGPVTSAEKSFKAANSSVWSDVSSKVTTSNSKIQSQFGKMKSGLKNLEGSFNSSQGRIDSSMGKVPTAVTKHVRKATDFIQRAMITPVNDKLLGPAKIAKIGNLPRYATGGVIPGYSPGNDSVLAMLSPGESVLRPEVTRALGKDTIHQLNGAAMKGQLPAFATGGIIGKWDKAENSMPGDFTTTAEPIIKSSVSSFVDGVQSLAWMGGVMKAGVKKAQEGVLGQLAIKDAAFGFGGANTSAALAWAKTQNGKPYQWGGNGNPSWDCSGFMSAIESVIRGEKPHRRWATGAFGANSAPPGWERNLKSPFMIGITNAGVGHTAGTLNGVNVESRGGDGVIVGKRARGYNDHLFTSQWGFKGAIASGGGGGGSGKWAETVQAVLRMLGWYSATNVSNVLKAIQKESNGDPKAINLNDSNARAGHPSQGLLQTIPSTFAAWAGPYKSRGITDPFANIYAAVRYAHNKYGAGWSARMAQPGGYWTGTKSASPGLAMVGENGRELINLRGGERIYNNRETEDILSGGKSIVVNVYEAKHETTSDAIVRGLQQYEALHGGF